MRALLFFAVAGLAALAPSRASAQQRPCSEGRVRTAASQGRCCWPDQSWNTTSARCEGPPSCPAGFTEEGDGCVRSSAAPAPVPAPTPAASALSAAPASFPVAIPAAPPVRVAPVVIAQGSVSPTAPPPTAPEAGIAPDGSIRYGVLPEHGATPVVARPVALAPPPVAVAPAPAPAPIAAPLPVVVAPPLVAPSPPPEPRTQPEPAPEPPPRREPYNGGPIPEGTHVESRVNVGLVVSGPLLFVAGYPTWINPTGATAQDLPRVSVGSMGSRRREGAGRVRPRFRAA